MEQNEIIGGSVLLLTPFEDLSGTAFAGVIESGLVLSVPIDVCFYQPLRHLFKDVHLYDYVKRSMEVGFSEMNREIIQLVKMQRPEYVLWVSWGDYYEVRESTFDTIRSEDSSVIGWFLDDDVRFDYYSRWWAPSLDYAVTNDEESVEKYRALGVPAQRAICTGLSVDIDWQYHREKYGVTFVGSLRADRADFIEKLREAGITPELFGSAGGRFVEYQEMIDIYSSSRINLNFSRTFRFMKLAVKARIFEICLSGGFLLTEYFPGIEEYFEIDREIVCFQTTEEMIEKIEYYLAHEDERRAIARAGWERARRDHSSVIILSKVFHTIRTGSDTANHAAAFRRSGQVRKHESRFFINWGEAFLAENRPVHGRDALHRAFSAAPLSSRVWFYYALSFLPAAVRKRVLAFTREIYHRLHANSGAWRDE